MKKTKEQGEAPRPSSGAVRERVEDWEDAVVLCITGEIGKEHAISIDLLGKRWYVGFTSVEDAKACMAQPTTTGELLRFSRARPESYSVLHILNMAVKHNKGGIAIMLDPLTCSRYASGYRFIEVPE